MSGAPQLRFYKDENIKGNQLEKLTEIYNLFRDDNPKYISRNECVSLKTAENFIFVFSNFEGPAYDHLSALKTRIISVQCMFSSLQSKKKLPRSLTPIFSFSMMDLNVCCTNIEKKLREDIYNRVSLMRGKTSKIFTETVTHLVTTEVGSAKYHAAAGMKIPVMLPDWIFNVWKDSEVEDIHGTDSKYLKYNCPIFNKYIVCASGFTETTKKEIKELIESEGGTYTGELVCGTTTHLITNEAKGSKYEHAKLWKINVVKSTWIYESKKANYCLSEKNYQLEGSTHTSTPTDSRVFKTQIQAPNIDLSVISKPNQTGNTINATKLINETENVTRQNISNSLLNFSCSNTTVTSSTTSLNNKNNITKDINSRTISNYPNLLKELNIIGKIKLTLFDGIGIYCENFEQSINQKLNKICNYGGAIKFEEYNSDVTHVIVNQVNEKNCKAYIELNPEVNIVTIDWLIDSCKENQLSESKNYCVHKNALNSVKTPKKRARTEKKNEPMTELTSRNFQDSDINGYLSQYLKVEAGINKETQNTTPKIQNKISRPSLSLQKEIEYESKNTTISNQKSINKQSIKISNCKGVFSNKKLQIIGFDEIENEELENLLLEKGACIIPLDPNISVYSSRNCESVDYTIMPMTIPTRISNNNPATIYWMRKCIEQNKLLELCGDVFYQPIPRYNNDKPLNICVITISGYTAHEKDNIANLCKLLGAKIQNSLSLKRAGDMMANTHLVCNKAIGPKYIAAKSWHLPVISIHWIIDCCVTGTKADESKYPIETITDNKELIRALASIRQCELETSLLYNGSFKNDYSIENKTETESDISTRKTNKSKGSFLEVREVSETSEKNTFIEPQNSNDSSLTCHNESKRAKLDNSKTVTTNKNSDDENKNFGNNPDSIDNINEIVLASIENSEKIKHGIAVNNQAATLQASNYGTPCNPRLKELRRTNTNFSPMINLTNENNNDMNTNSPNQSIDYGKQNKIELSTPNWMKPQIDGENPFKYNPIIDCDKVIEAFKTPEVASQKKLRINLNKYGDTPLDELFSKAVTDVKEKIKIPQYYSNYATSPAFEYSFDKSYNSDKEKRLATNIDVDERITPTPNSEKQIQQVLKNIRIYVSRKLVKQQTELYQISEILGAEFLWTYENSCTHFIYSGKLTDTNKELKIAKDQKKVIVLPSWIHACREQNSHVDESSYLFLNNNTTKNIRRSSVHKKISNDEQIQIKAISIPEDNLIETVDLQNKEYIMKKKKVNEVLKSIEKPIYFETCNEEYNEYEKETNSEQSYNKEANEQATNAENYQDSLINESSNQIPEIIPDSMDIKMNFIDQLQDKLASIKNKTNLSRTKWSKNTSGLMNTPQANETTDFEASSDQTRLNEVKKIVQTETESQILANYNFMENNQTNGDETVLTEEQALRELDNSRSKWGISSGGNNEINQMNKKKTKSIDKNELDITDTENTSENDCNISAKRKVNTSSENSSLKDQKSLKSSNKLNKLNNSDSEDSPSLIKTKKYSVMEPPASSQIQMTIWKEDNINPISAARSKARSIAKKSDNKNDKKDAIADRIIQASRVSSANQKKYCE